MSIRTLYSAVLAALLVSLSTLVLAAGPKIPKSPDQVCPIKVGQALPDVKVNNLDGTPVALRDTLGKKGSVLIFYRGSWCPYCNRHLGELKTIEADLQKLGYKMIAVSPDLPKNLKKSMDKNELTYDLYSDASGEAIVAMGLAFEQQSDKKSFLTLLETSSGNEHHLLPVPAAVVVNKKGKVEFIFYSPDYTVRIDPKVLLAAAQSAAS